MALVTKEEFLAKKAAVKMALKKFDSKIKFSMSMCPYNYSVICTITHSTHDCLGDYIENPHRYVVGFHRNANSQPRTCIEGIYHPEQVEKNFKGLTQEIIKCIYGILLEGRDGFETSRIERDAAMYAGYKKAIINIGTAKRAFFRYL